ncbi:hypothetical protein P167DRAFT_566163 [Morchella conica CCBAS932]|uniref:DNA replication regulator SLD2 n=1 Tax=Morchella conica CCBAS932 TaxID=1392247 RepID=A0A3N4KP29_9PEZI|nr:hypothetical protein P167DRAFT_566163 [Morchella conica CCBAS932]
MAGTEAQKTLRQELKEWERAFADANGGRKPTREEIKRDKVIAAKYTEYYKIQPSSKAPKSKSSQSADPKPRDPKPHTSRFTTTTPTAIPYDPTNPFASGPSPSSSSVKSTTTIPSRPTTSTSVSTTSIFRTPSKPSQLHRDLYDSPLSTRGRRLFGNRIRDSVGPTPQKTGKVLGIFESFGAAVDDADTDAAAATPSHKRVLRPSPRKTTTTAAVASPALSTPRKRKAGEMGTPRTPGTTQKTPGTQRDVFSTPAFLRRSFIGSLEESPAVVEPRRRRPLVKGLSEMVKELRRWEDDAHRDDEEAMREMEREMEGAEAEALPVKKRVLEVVEVPVEVEENDPETGLPPLPEGAWREERRVEEEESGEEKEDKGRKWKKKGLKRQHRRVIMRPTAKTTTTTTTTGETDDAPPPPPNPEDAELPDAGYSDEDLSDLDNLPDEPVRKAVAVPVPVERKGRKISEAAHANYRRVNIRGSKGAKAVNGRAGRFRGKRR